MPRRGGSCIPVLKAAISHTPTSATFSARFATSRAGRTRETTRQQINLFFIPVSARPGWRENPGIFALKSHSPSRQIRQFSGRQNQVLNFISRGANVKLFALILKLWEPNPCVKD